MREDEPSRSDVRPRRRWFSLSIRTLLVLILVASVLAAWLGKHIVRSRIQRPIVAKIQAAGGTAHYSYRTEFDSKDTTGPPTGSAIANRVFGDDIFKTVNVVTFYNPISDAEIEDLYKLTNLLELSITGPVSLTSASMICSALTDWVI